MPDSTRLRKDLVLVNSKDIVYDASHIESDDSPVVAKASTKEWQARAKGLLKAELKRRDLSYADLADRLEAIGVNENRRNISNKIGRGSFTAVFLLQCLAAIGCQTLHLENE